MILSFLSHITTRVIDADHEAYKLGERQFEHHKLSSAKKVTAGLHSNASVCYVLFLTITIEHLSISLVGWVERSYVGWARPTNNIIKYN